MSHSCHCMVETLHNWPPESTKDMNGLWHHREKECESIASVLEDRKVLADALDNLVDAIDPRHFERRPGNPLTLARSALAKAAPHE